jgi:uncharacterized protein YcaQ
MAAVRASRLALAHARHIWLRAQGLHTRRPFGDGPEATLAAVEHLGYVQIDTINVIERCHHHILWTRIPTYRREHLHRAQAVDKTVFEYWTHALAYVPTSAYRFFMPEMARRRATPGGWFGSVDPADVRRVLSLIRKEGPLSIRDIADDVLVDKNHPWASRKPSKRALQLAFFTGALTVSARSGMLKTYELAERHFGWERRPRPASEQQVADYMLDRTLRAQGVVSLDSICHLDVKRKPAVRRAIEARLRRRRLRAVAVEGAEGVEHWAAPEALEEGSGEKNEDLTHVLSPFDPLIIQRKRLKLFFGYQHRFEAYVPKEKRSFGYFALPVLVGDEIVAAIDLKADRRRGRLQVQQWTWLNPRSADAHKARVEEELHRFEEFQIGQNADETTKDRLSAPSLALR